MEITSILRGMCNEAVKAYLKLGDYKMAVNTCVNLSQWGLAIELAQKYNMPHINALLTKHGGKLLKDGRLPEAIELQRKAGRFLDAARLVVQLAEKEISKKSYLLRIKKLYLLAGLLCEEYIKSVKSFNVQHPDEYIIDRSVILADLPYEDSKLIDRIWHCTEAYHYMILAQKQIRFGIIRSALVTSLRLQDYEDVLKSENIFSLIALASCADRSMGILLFAFNNFF